MKNQRARETRFLPLGSEEWVLAVRSGRKFFRETREKEGFVMSSRDLASVLAWVLER